MENKNNRQFKVIKFNEAYVAPAYKYDKKNNIITWGAKNDYPNYILDLYNNYGASVHKSIINKKTKLISGKGFIDIIDTQLLEFVKKNKLEAEVIKATLDYELFNAFAFEIVYTNGGEIFSVKHIPVSKIRKGIQTEEINFSHVWISKDWSKIKKEGFEPELVREFNPYLKQGKQILFYNEYNPGSDFVYAIPQYSTALNYIELSYEISKFHLNQAKQGYSPSFILDIKGSSIPSEEEMNDFAYQFEKEYSGTDNSGKIVITYSENEGGVTLTPIELNSSDERFIALNDQIQENIVQASEIPPQLIILTPGKLGSTDERRELQKEFQDFYITPRQETIERILNEILSVQFSEELKLKQFNEE